MPDTFVTPKITLGFTKPNLIVWLKLKRLIKPKVKEDMNELEIHKPLMGISNATSILKSHLANFI